MGVNNLFFVPIAAVIVRDCGYKSNTKEQLKKKPAITLQTSDDWLHFLVFLFYVGLVPAITGR